MERSRKNTKAKRLLEAKFSVWMCQNLKVAGSMVLNVHGHQMQSPGWPDLQIYHRIWSGHIELKMTPEKPTDLQDSRLRGLWARGTNACWMDCGQDGVIRLWVLGKEDSPEPSGIESEPSGELVWACIPSPFKRMSRKTGHGPGILHFLARHVTNPG